MKLPRVNRIISLIFCFLLFPGLLAVPARADEINTNNWINVFDYGNRVGDIDNRIDLTTERDSNNRVIIQYDLGAVNYVSDIDMIFRTDSDSFTLSRFSSGGGPLTIIHLFDDFYRAVGTFDREYVSALYVYLFAQSGTYFDILSLRVSLVPFSQFNKTCSGIVYYSGNEVLRQSPIVFPADTDSGLDNHVEIDNTGNPDIFYRSELVISEWQSMDYIQLNLSSYCTTIDSISVQINGVSVPYELNHVDSNLRSGLDLVLIDLLLDVRDFKKDFDRSIDIVVTGTVGANQNGNFYIQDCFGLIQIEQPSLWSYWFTQVGQWFSAQTASLSNTFSSWGQSLKTSFDSGMTVLGNTFDSGMTALGNTFATWGQSLKTSIDSGLSAVQTDIDDFRRTMTAWSREIHTAITTWGQNIYNAIVGNGEGDAFNQEVNDANDKLSDASNAMNDFTRPAADAVVPDLGDFDTSSISILSQFFNNDLVSPLVSAGLAIWLIGIIFGV